MYCNCDTSLSKSQLRETMFNMFKHEWRASCEAANVFNELRTYRLFKTEFEKRAFYTVLYLSN